MPADEPDEPTGAVRGRRSPGRHRTDRPTAAPRTPEVGFPAVHRPGQRPPDRPRHARGGDRYAAHGGSDGGGSARDDAARDAAWDSGRDTSWDDSAWDDSDWDDSAWGGEGRDQLWDDRARDAPQRDGPRDPYGAEAPADEPQPAAPARPAARRVARSADPYGADAAGPRDDRSEASRAELFGAAPLRSTPRRADPDDADPGHPDGGPADATHAAHPGGAAPPARSAPGAAAPDPDPDRSDVPRSARLGGYDDEGYAPPPYARSASRGAAARRYADPPDADEAYGAAPIHDRHGPPEDLFDAAPPRSTTRGAGPGDHPDDHPDERYAAHPDDARPFPADPADPGSVPSGRSASRGTAARRYAGPPDADEAYGPDPARDRHGPPEDLFGAEPARPAPGGPDHDDPQPAPPSRSASRGTAARRYADPPGSAADEAYGPYRERPDVPHADLFGAQPPHRAAPGDPADGGYPPLPYGAEPQPAPPVADHGDEALAGAPYGERPGAPHADDRAPGAENGAARPRRGRQDRVERPAEPVLPALPDRRPGDPPGAPAELFVETTAETPALTPELLSRHANSLERQAAADATEPARDPARGSAREPAREPAQRRRVLGVPLPALPGWAARLLPGARAADGADPDHGTSSEHGHGHGHGPARPAGRRVRILIAALLVPCALATLAGLALLWPTGGPPATAQPTGADLVHGQVTATRIADCSGGGGSGECLALVVHMADGPRADRDLVQMVPIEPSTPEFTVGDRVVLAWSGADPDEPGSYQVVDFQRDVPLAWLAGLFAAAVLVLGRWRGLAALAALGLSFVVLLFFVVPAILAGRDPLSVAVVGACLIMFAVLYLTHGPSARTSTAVLGTLLSLALIGALGAGFSAAADLTGLDDQTTNLIATLGTGVDARGLLLAGVVIGALGVLDDVTVTQTSAVWELRYANPTLGARQLFTSAMRIGRDHVASAVNTLVLAYAGAALPLLLLFSLSGRGFGDVVTSQEVATEIVRTLVGSIGLVASVPITTALAAAVASRESVQPAEA